MIRLRGSVAELARNQWTVAILGVSSSILPVAVARLATSGGEWAALCRRPARTGGHLPPRPGPGDRPIRSLPAADRLPGCRLRVKELKLLDELFIPATVLITIITCRHGLRRRIQPVRDVALIVLIAAALASTLINGVRPEVW